MELIGHTAAKNFLERITRETFPHTFLIVGPRGVGKTTIADLCAAKLVGCTYEQAATNPNIIRLSAGVNPKTGNPRSNIPVEAIRELRPLFSLRSAGPRIIMVERAEELHQESSNALLKIMEEPIANLYFILLARSEDAVLQTIRSRSALLTVSAVPQAALVSVLHQRFQPDEFSLSRALEIAEGRPGIAIRYFEDEAFRNRVISEYTRFDSVLAARRMSDAEVLLTDLFGKKDKHIEGRADLAEILEWWLSWLRRRAPAHPALNVIAKTIPLLFENMHPRLLMERIVIAITAG